MKMTTPHISVSVNFQAYASAHMFADNGCAPIKVSSRPQEVTPTLISDRKMAAALAVWSPL